MQDAVFAIRADAARKRAVRARQRDAGLQQRTAPDGAALQVVAVGGEVQDAGRRGEGFEGGLGCLLAGQDDGGGLIAAEISVSLTDGFDLREAAFEVAKGLKLLASGVEGGADEAVGLLGFDEAGELRLAEIDAAEGHEALAGGGPRFGHEIAAGLDGPDGETLHQAQTGFIQKGLEGQRAEGAVGRDVERRGALQMRQQRGDQAVVGVAHEAVERPVPLGAQVAIDNQRLQIEEQVRGVEIDQLRLCIRAQNRGEQATRAVFTRFEIEGAVDAVFDQGRCARQGEHHLIGIGPAALLMAPELLGCCPQ